MNSKKMGANDEIRNINSVKSQSAHFSLTSLPAYNKLKAHFNKVESLHMRRLFSIDNLRFDKFSLSLNGLLLDYSKNRITDETMSLLFQLAQETGVEKRRKHLLASNTHEENGKHGHRPAAPEKLNERMTHLARQLRQGEWRGYSGKSITDILMIDNSVHDACSGTKMVAQALAHISHRQLKIHYNSPQDEIATIRTLDHMDPETTLIIIRDKKFARKGEISNGMLAKEWFLQKTQNRGKMAKHFAAITAKTGKARKFGIAPEMVFKDNSSQASSGHAQWTANALPLMIAIGPDLFQQFMQGVEQMDEHYLAAPLEQNMPVVLALLDIWYNNFFGLEIRAMLPYDNNLRGLADYLNRQGVQNCGCPIDRSGNRISYATGMLTCGARSTCGLDSYYRMLQRNNKMIPADVIISLHSTHAEMQDLHERRLARALARTEALMMGRSYTEACMDAETLLPQMQTQQGSDTVNRLVNQGNHPSNTLVLQEITPHTLGLLVALYQYKIYVQRIVWNLNDASLMERDLDAEMTQQILLQMHDFFNVESHDASTNHLINLYRQTMSPVETRDTPGNIKVTSIKRHKTGTIGTGGDDDDFDLGKRAS